MLKIGKLNGYNVASQHCAILRFWLRFFRLAWYGLCHVSYLRSLCLDGDSFARCTWGTILFNLLLLPIGLSLEKGRRWRFSSRRYCKNRPSCQLVFWARPNAACDACAVTRLGTS